MLRLGAPDAGGRHELAVGDELEVRLPENATTGHRWQLVSSDDTVLAAVGDSTEPATADRPGAGGERVFRLRAAAPGEVDLVARSGRRWENADTAAGVPGLTYGVTVRPA